MRRFIYDSLAAWKQKVNRKPLILFGARQVGKTYIIKEFGQNEFSNMVYVNCHKNTFAENLFHDLRPTRIVSNIEKYYDIKIIPGQTLLVFDEIQEVANGIASLKYFCEELCELHVIAAGSLLGISLREGESYPVGKVNTLRMYPMSFGEFLLAKGRNGLYDVVSSLQWESMISMHDELTNLLRQYFFTGGMPEVIANYIKNENIIQAREIQHEILDAYEKDFSKHSHSQSEKIRMVWNSLPAQLARENKKFIFGAVRKGSRASTYEETIQWLTDAGLSTKVELSRKPSKPLKFYADHNAFKLFVFDCGLLACMAEANPKDMLFNQNVFAEFKGAFSENYVLQQMCCSGCSSVYYYSKEQSNLEIDFLFETEEEVIPIEVKAEVNVKSKSLSQFIKHEFSKCNLKGVRFSMLPYKDQGWMVNIPLYAVEAYIKHSLPISISDQ